MVKIKRGKTCRENEKEECREKREREMQRSARSKMKCKKRRSEAWTKAEEKNVFVTCFTILTLRALNMLARRFVHS